MMGTELIDYFYWQGAGFGAAVILVIIIAFDLIELLRDK